MNYNLSSPHRRGNKGYVIHDLSSPHTRGTHSRPWHAVKRLAFIPAYAGHTRPALVTYTRGRFHPRIRGAHVTPFCGVLPISLSSPRSAGQTQELSSPAILSFFHPRITRGARGRP